MKKLLLVTLVLLYSMSIAFAQSPTANSEAKMEDYERYIDKRLEMNFRLNAMEAIGLTSEEINAFNPVFDNYTTAKDRLSEKKFDLLEDYSEEMDEEEDADDRSEETSDFIEDYWEAEIAEMELKKDYYDILENKIPFQKAIDFFLYEETVENSMKYNMVAPLMPTIINIEKFKKDRKTKRKAMATGNITQKEWNRYIDKRLEMDFRLAAMEEMYLTPEEIEAFNPLFDQYMDAKENITKKKFNLIDKYATKIAKEDDAKDRAEEMSDFIEDYWEAEIAAMKIKEAYFDKMENQIPYMKVAQFFLFEETVENRMKYDAMIAKMPSIILIEKKMKKKKQGKNGHKMDKTATDKEGDTSMNWEEKENTSKGKMMETETSMADNEKQSGEGMTSENGTPAEVKDVTVTTYPATTNISAPAKPFAIEITNFDSWVASHKGQMSLEHGYTHDGLIALTAAVEATAKATNTTIDDWAAKKATVSNAANSITIDPKSTMHADWVSEAFIILGNAVKDLNEKNEYTYAGGQVSLLQFKANQINPDVLLLKQSNVVYDYFETANQALKDIWGYAAKKVVSTEVMTTPIK